MKRKNVLFISLIFLFTIIIIFLLVITAPKPEKKKPVKKIVEVKVKVLKPENYRDFYKTGCEIDPLDISNVKSQVAGNIIYVSKKFEVGGNFKKGEKILQIDKSKYEHKVKSIHNNIKELKNTLKELKVELKKNNVMIEIAKTDYEAAKRELERNNFLLEKGVISKSQYDNILLKLKSYEGNFKNYKLNNRSLKYKIKEIKNRISASEEELKIAEKDLLNCTIYAPFSGIISQKYVNSGDTVTIGTPLFSMISGNKAKVKFFVPLNVRDEIKNGEEILIVDRETDKRYSGKISFISTSAETKNRMFQITGIIDKNPPPSGTFMEVIVPLKTYKNVLLLPLNSLKNGGVFVVEKNVAKFKKVKIGKILRKYFEIVSGVKAGDRVVVDGMDLLKDGDSVKIEGDIK